MKVTVYDVRRAVTFAALAATYAAYVGIRYAWERARGRHATLVDLALNRADSRRAELIRQEMTDGPTRNPDT